MNLSEHFSLEELIASETAVRQGIDNTPDDEILSHLRYLAAGLEHVRMVLGAPIHITSGYRSEVLNRSVGGSVDSAHTQGLAADLICPGFGTPLEVCRAIHAAFVPFDQLIQEGTWCHFAVAAPGITGRHEILTAHFAMGGHATYTLGLA